jgi:ATP-dependent DNA helicase RecQ
MRTHISSLQRLVLNPSSELSKEDQSNSLLRRIARTLRGDLSQVGPADIAVLVRQALISCQEAGGAPATLRVPAGGRWPDVAEWSLFGCEAQTAAIGYYFVKATPDYPNWLATGVDAIESADRADARRADRRVPSDPAIQDSIGYEFYSTPGQRAAVRMTCLMPASSTALVLLPTGAGKSLIFHSAALLGLSESAVTVVVVPTTALARDQELRFKELLGTRNRSLIAAAGGTDRAFCYHGGLPETEKESLRQSIAEGTIPILFASPESLLNSLRIPLFHAARRGKLRYYVVDEVHMVAQWGEQFRPEFQMLAGLRSALQEECPPGFKLKTLLLTATLTSDSYQTIRSLFSDEDFRVVSELALRPEPRYLIENTLDEIEKAQKVEDAIRLLPRPMILYTSRRRDAEIWESRIRSMGFRRVRVVLGGIMGTKAGERILEEWKDGDVDIIVATSAFGLGVDQNDVRTVLHACLPESIDRFYQEVGRAGRDGRASVSVLITSPDDERTATSLSSKTRISIERGFERWIEMWTRKKRISDSVFTVSLDEKPIDIDFSGPQNASWNLRTLVLMRAANLIDFFAHLPPELERDHDEEDDSYEIRRDEALQRFFSEVAIRIIDSGHSDRTFWERHVEAARRNLRQVEDRSIAWTRELLNLQRPIQSLLREVYTVPELDLRPPVVTSAAESRISSWIDPEVLGIPPLEMELSESIKSALSPCRDGAGRFWISYEIPMGDSLRMRAAVQPITEVLKFCVAGGFVELALPDWIGSPETWAVLARQTSAKFLVRTTPSSTSADGLYVPRVTMLGGSDVDQKSLGLAMSADHPGHLIFFPTNLRDPRNLERCIADMFPHVSIHNILSRLQA